VSPPLNPATVAILPWGHVIEDFLEPIGLDLERFAGDMTGGWLFGCVEAIQRAGGRAVIICPSTAVRRPTRLRHVETDTPIWAVPPSRACRIARRMAERGGAVSRLARQVAPWLSTPVWRTARVLRYENVDVVICQEHNEARLPIVELVGRAIGTAVWATYQGGVEGPTELERLVHPIALRRAQGLLVGSAAERRRLLARDPSLADLVVDVPNPIDTAAWVPTERASARARLGIDEGIKVVSWYGRVERHRKGLDVLAGAWANVEASHGSDVLLLMTGTGPDREVVAADLAGLGHVRWVDSYTLDRAAIRTQLAACDLAVLSSRHEGFAVTLLEALASGRAAVAADVPGVDDLAPGGESDGCLVVPPGDVDALADAIGQLLDDPARRQRMELAGRRRAVEAFGLEAVGGRILQVLAARPRRRGWWRRQVRPGRGRRR
jgi:glycosyltransferase involved in cell wall biosynthesis